MRAEDRAQRAGRGRVADAGALLCCLAFALTLASAYVQRERVHYAYDFRNHHDRTRAMAEFLRGLPESPVVAAASLLERIWTSTGQDYSDYPTIALAPLFLLWGDARAVYVFGLVTIYLMSFALIIGYVASTLIPSHPRPIFWLAVTLTLLTPATWIPTLRGYPDIGGAALIGLAVALYVSDPGPLSRWRIAIIGVTLALAILFRRHYIFGATAFIATLMLHLGVLRLFRAKHGPTGGAHRLVGVAGPPAGVAAAMLMTLLTLGAPFLDNLVFVNYKGLYAAWEVPWKAGLSSFARTYGYLAWMLAGIGLCGGMVTGLVDRRVAAFIMAFGALSLAQWVTVAQQVGHHYPLHLAFLIVTGLTACGWVGWRLLRPRLRPVLVMAAALYLAINAVQGLASSPPLAGGRLRGLLSARVPPLVDPNFDEVSRLVLYLAGKATRDEPIYVGGAGPSHDVYRGAAASLLPENAALNILWGPTVDSRDFYPLEHLLIARYIVVGFPKEAVRSVQRVSRVVVDIFRDDWEITRDFTLLPEEFVFDSGTRARVYARHRPTARATALNTFDAIEAYVGKRPGSQPSWVRLDSSPSYTAVHKRSGRHDIVPLDGARSDGDAAEFLYIDGFLTTGTLTGRLTHDSTACDPAGCVADDCARASVRASLVDRIGQVRASAPIDRPAAANGSFAVRLETDAASRLVLDITHHSGTDAGGRQCSPSVRDLAVR